ncbi:MAG: hypothetical protein ACP5P4_13530 [Steroidobacteraceae bacterium]
MRIAGTNAEIAAVTDAGIPDGPAGATMAAAVKATAARVIADRRASLATPRAVMPLAAALKVAARKAGGIAPIGGRVIVIVNAI